tara:strand:- start:10957 stop:11487 length:531 start_codon:yes stop_codon:yes gene_type:complete
MNKILVFIMCLFTFTAQSQKSIYNIKINTINGDPLDLNQFRGKFLLFVNVASKCGFTKQYEGLEQLHQGYKENLVVIGVPCNQFGGQEPGTEKEIKQFCAQQYGVSFLLTEKINVKGDKQHMLYQWLTDKKLNGNTNSTVKWNFQKYIVGKNGDLIEYFYSTTDPMSRKITSILRQ